MKVVDIEHEAHRVLRNLRFNKTTFNKPFTNLSRGWRMRCMLAAVLIQKPDIMILNKPTNFLNLLGVIWLENHLKQLRDTSETSIILVSHDRDFLNMICKEIVILQYKSLSYFKRNLSAYKKDLTAQKLYWHQMKETQD
jgi:ATPase subunit of ABC transporter with duplicated ATPase domains